MSFLPGPVRMVANGFYEMYLDLRSFDPYNINWATFHWSAAILFAVGIGIVVMIIVAQFTDANDQKSPGPLAHNWALGKNTGVVRKEGDPPIPPPTEVVSLRIYPIKSCRGIEITSTRLRKSGLTLDRNWMFIDKKDRNFLTIRSDPSMTLIDTAIIPDPASPARQLLEVSIHGTDARVSFPAFPTKDWLEKNTTLSTVEIWEETTDGYEYSDITNDIFTEFFKKSVALIYKGPTARNTAVNGSKELYGSPTPHHFADVMSLTVASEASIRDLNRRLDAKSNETGISDLTIERFRPNIIVRGRDSHPWEEDTWKRIRLLTTLPEKEAIYKIDLDVVARCARCQVPNVNPDTASKHPKEPWDELMKFRRVDQGGAAKWKPCFGMLCIPRNEGVVQVGATRLEVLETTANHLYSVRKFEDL